METGRNLKYPVHMSDAELNACRDIALSSNTSRTVKKRCLILMELNSYKKGCNMLNEICKKIDVSLKTIFNTAKKFFKFGFSNVIKLDRNENSNKSRLKVDAHIESLIITMLCGPVPEGRKRWTVKLATEEFNKNFLTSNDEKTVSLSKSTVWRAMNKNELKPHLSKYWCLAAITPEFVMHMETILNLYSLPYNEFYPLVCMDECPFQLLGDSRQPIPARPGQVEIRDFEYVRLGTRCIFVFIEPKTGKIYTIAKERRTAIDWAYEIRFLVDVVYPNAKKVILVSDQLNTHVLQSLYKAFSPEEASRISDRLELNYTPKHGSWLNIAETGINIVKTECLPDRFTEDDIKNISNHLEIWQNQRNKNPKPINWTFSDNKAREKCPWLYKFSDEYVYNSDDAKYEDINKLNYEERCMVTPQISIIENCELDVNSKIIDLIESRDGENIFWSIRKEDSKVILDEPIGKKATCLLLGKRSSSSDGWLVPKSTKLRKSKEAEEMIFIQDCDYKFIAYCEAIIKLYTNEFDESNPVICIEKSPIDISDVKNNSFLIDFKQKINLPNKPNNEEEEGEEVNTNAKYKNNDTDKLIGVTLAIEPNTGRKFFRLDDYADHNSWAKFVDDLLSNKYPNAEKLHLIIPEEYSDEISSLYTVFSPDKSIALLKRINIVPVPSNGKWLNCSTVSSVAFLRQCISRGIKRVQDLGEYLIEWKNKIDTIKFKFNLEQFRKIFSISYYKIDTIPTAPT